MGVDPTADRVARFVGEIEAFSVHSRRRLLAAPSHNARSHLTASPPATSSSDSMGQKLVYLSFFLSIWILNLATLLLVKRLEKDPECSALTSVASVEFPVTTVGFEPVCMRRCQSRAYLRCSERMSVKLGRGSNRANAFNCYNSNRSDAKKLLKQLIKRECRRLSPWHLDFGCKNTDGTGKHGCKSLRCPMQCIKLESCAWYLGNVKLSQATVLESFSNPTSLYTGRCGRADEVP